MGLNDGEELVAEQPFRAAGVIVSGVNKASKPVEDLLARADLRVHEDTRARKGTALKTRLKDASLRRV